MFTKATILSWILMPVFAGTLMGAQALTFKPAELAFGEVPQGRAKTMTLTLKASAFLAVSVKVLPPNPYTAAPSNFTLQGMSYGELIVTLPATAPGGVHNGKMVLQVTPVLPAGSTPPQSETMEIAVSGHVIEFTPQDLSATGELKNCSGKGNARSCTVNLMLLTTDSLAIRVKTHVFESRDGGSEAKTLDEVIEYQPAGGTSFSYEASKLAKTRKLTLRIVMDPENEIPETNEDNNTSVITLDLK